MNMEELKIFYLLDNHYYLVKENPNLKKILHTLNGKYQEIDIQKFIDKLISWYYVKYSNVFLESLFNEEQNTDTTILDIMSFDTLRKSFGVFEDELFEDSFNDDAKVILQKNLIVMAGWGLIYHKNSTPEYGYYRASKLLDDFNSFYSWNLTSSIYLPILKKDYSPQNEENIRLLERYKKKHSHDKSKNIKIKLFRK